MRPIAVAVLVVVVAACDFQTEPLYGNHAGLSHDNLPSPPQTDGGAKTDASVASACDGGVPAFVDGSTCSISFTTTIFPQLMSATGKWKCADSMCHGGTSNDPAINNPDTAYANLAAYKISVGGTPMPYINPCTTDPTKSAILCNLQGTCGLQAMPIPNATLGTAKAEAADVAKVTTWLQCGSPFN